MTVLDTLDQIRAAQLLTLRAMLKLEIKGMHKRGRSAYAILKDLGYKGTRTSVLEQLNQDLAWSS